MRNRVFYCLVLWVSFLAPGLALQPGRYDFATNFGQSDPDNYLHFDTLEALEEYFKSFGYLASFLSHAHTKSLSEGENATQELRYEVKQKAISFQGSIIKHPFYYTDDVSHYGKRYFTNGPPVEAMFFYHIKQHRDYDKMFAISVEIDYQGSYRWNYAGFESFEGSKQMYEVIYYHDYPIKYIYRYQLNPFASEVRYGGKKEKIYEISQVSCSQPDGEFYQPRDFQDGWDIRCTCILTQGDTCLTATVKQTYHTCQGEQNGCHMEGDPVDLSSGNVYEEVVDFIIPSPNPIVIARYYSSELGQWNFSYSRHVEFSEEGAVLARDNGSRYVFKKIEGALVPPAGFQGSLQLKPSITIYSAPDGDVEKYDKQGRLFEITTRQGLVMSIRHMGKGMLIDDHFGHQVRTTVEFDIDENPGPGPIFKPKTPDTNYIKKIVWLPNGSQIIYHFENYVPFMLTSVTYPQGGKNFYTYEQKGGGYKLIQAANSPFSTWEYDSKGRAIMNKMWR